MSRRIGMVVGELRDTKRVGSERRYTELIRGLRDLGDEIHLFAHRWDAAAARGLHTHAVAAPGPASLRPLAFALGALAAVRPWRDRLDLVHSHTKSLGDDVALWWPALVGTRYPGATAELLPFAVREAAE